MRTRFHVQRATGYTDGRESWRKEIIPAAQTYTRESATKARDRLAAAHPNSKFRVRKVTLK